MSLLPPSTTALQAFLATAREGTTLRASDRLPLSQSAISKQIRSLEAHLGVALFDRSARGLRLTEAGERYRPYAEAALDQLAKGARQLREHDSVRQPIRLHMLAVVGERWLIGRFPAFSAAHPDIDVQFTNYVSDTASEEPDLEIRHGAGPWPDQECLYLFGRRVVLVAAPDLLARFGGFKHVEDIQRLTYLQHFQMPTFWAEFTEAHGLRGAVPTHTMRYGYLSVVMKAAVAGMGVALVPACFVREELASGALVNPLGLAFVSALGCWLTLPQDRPRPPGLVAFVEWLTQEARAFSVD